MAIAFTIIIIICAVLIAFVHWCKEQWNEAEQIKTRKAQAASTAARAAVSNVPIGAWPKT